MSPGHWQWVIDQRAMQVLHDREARRAKLAIALQTRILSDKEMKMVMQTGVRLFTPDGVPYRESEKQAEFNEAIVQQYRLRQISTR